MKTKQFIESLRQAQEAELIFVNSSGTQIQPGYHLTEIKAATFRTVDCGGKTNDWRETIVQLWMPADSDDEYMSAAKFLRIYEKVVEMIPLDSDAEIRIEYGDPNFFPSTYRVSSVSREGSAARVLLEPPEMTCKARDRRAETMQQSCCGQAAIACC